MNLCRNAITLLLSALLLPCHSQAQNPVPELKGPYLGQTPPGLTPKRFAPGLVGQKDWEGGTIFAPDMKTFYFTRQKTQQQNVETLVLKYRDNRWFLADTWPGYGPSFSPDGNTMFFGRRYKQRTDNGWSEMQSHGPDFEDFLIMSMKASQRGTYVFDEVGNNGDGVIRYARLVNGKRQKPQAFSQAINTGTWNAHPYIAPDESYLMWNGERTTGHGGSDLFISFRNSDGTWGKAINMGNKLNTEVDEGGPVVTPDGKYLFFSRVVAQGEGDNWPDVDTYWVDAKIIDTFRPH